MLTSQVDVLNGHDPNFKTRCALTVSDYAHIDSGTLHSQNLLSKDGWGHFSGDKNDSSEKYIRNFNALPTLKNKTKQI
jgi:hypothetical protein